MSLVSPTLTVYCILVPVTFPAIYFAWTAPHGTGTFQLWSSSATAAPQQP